MVHFPVIHDLHVDSFDFFAQIVLDRLLAFFMALGQYQTRKERDVVRVYVEFGLLYEVEDGFRGYFEVFARFLDVW